jgi:homoserine dehydrogenase
MATVTEKTSEVFFPNNAKKDLRGPRTVRIALLGYGRIGQAVGALAEVESERLTRAGVDLRCVSALVRDCDKPRQGPKLQVLAAEADRVLSKDVTVVVEVMGGIEPARSLIARALDAGIPVVTANKTLVAHHGLELAALAARRRTAFAYDAAVLAGVPFIGSLSRRPLIAAARRLEGVINGTSHFITNAIEAGSSFDDALAEATARGYAEPDSSADISGRDAAEKLAILLHLSGHRGVRVGDLKTTDLSVLAPSDFVDARRLGGTIKPVALASLDPAAPGAWVGPAFVASGHAFARLGGVTNALRLIGASGRDVLFAGPGAGPEATAITILDDVVEAVTSGAAESFEITGGAADDLPLDEPPPGRWFLATDDQPAFITVPTSWRALRQLVSHRNSEGHRTVAFPVLDS